MRIIILIILSLVSKEIFAQNIFTYLNYNEPFDVRSNFPIKEIVQVTTFFSSKGDNEIVKSSYTLNNKNRMLTEWRVNETTGQSFNFENTYLYDTLLIAKKSEVKHRSFPKEIRISHYILENSGNIAVIKTNLKGDTLERINFILNEQKLPVLLKVNDGEMGYETAEYDYFKNTVVTKVYDKNGNLKGGNQGIINRHEKSEDRTYDSFGNLIKNKNQVFELKYDKYGNWIKKIRFELKGNDKIERAVITRKITYRK